MVLKSSFVDNIDEPARLDVSDSVVHMTSVNLAPFRSLWTRDGTPWYPPDVNADM